MHIGYIVLAVRDVLRENLNAEKFAVEPFEADEIEVTPDGRPPAYMGKRFIGVYGNNWSAMTQDANTGLDATLGVTCVYTVRSPIFPQKKTGTDLYAQVLTGMASVCWQITKTVSMVGGSTTKIPLFDALKRYDEYDEFSIFEYLRWQSTDAMPQPVYDDWFTARNEHLEDESGMRIMGYTMSVRFGGARGGYNFL
jgi:hypothetical protein